MRKKLRSSVPRVREVHNVNVLTIDGRTEISLHLKLPGDLTLDEAHGVAENVEQSILDAVPEASTVRTHLEPLAEAVGRAGGRANGRSMSTPRPCCGSSTRRRAAAAGLRMLETGDGLVVFLTLALDPHTELVEAHRRRAPSRSGSDWSGPHVADVHVHTEP